MGIGTPIDVPPFIRENILDAEHRPATFGTPEKIPVRVIVHQRVKIILFADFLKAFNEQQKKSRFSVCLLTDAVY